MGGTLTHRRPLLALLIVVLALAGCGSSDDSAEETTPPTDTGGETEVLERMPEVPAATAPAPAQSSLREVFDDAQAMWQREFEEAGATYTPATLTLFRDHVDTACGTESANTGPFYCPADHGVYLDERFFDALGGAVGVRLGDFARAYVVAHEVGHHVQTLVGTLEQVRALDAKDPAGTNGRSVRFELQADCFAGVWAHTRYQRGQLAPGDIEDALRAAAIVGSDFQQKRATGTIRPEEWTHGSSAQRQHWLTVGLEQGAPAACDTFAAGAAG
jgi:uncharacterized protein